jgi:putative transposase
MLVLHDLEDLFDRLGTPEAGRKLVQTARMEGPVREIKSTGGNVITWYCSRKMARTIGTESRTGEFPAAIHYEWDPAVLEYYAQPLSVDIIQRQDNGRAVRYQHTPDFLLIRKDGIVIEEWRQEARLMRDAAKHPGRYVREVDGWRAPHAEAHFAAMGISYHLRSADEHPAELIQNLQFLGAYLDPNCPAPDGGFVSDLRDLFRDRPAIHLCELLNVDGFSGDAVYKAIADGTVICDLMNDDISETERVLVFRDVTTMLFHQKVGVAPLGELAERRDASITFGGRVRYEDQEYEVALVGAEKVLLKSDDGAVELPVALVGNLYREGRLAMVSRPKSVDPVQESMRKLQGIAPENMDRILQRMDWVATSHVAPGQAPVSKRTLQRYRRAMRDAGEAVIDQHLALSPNFRACGNRARKIPEAVVDLIAKTIREHYNTPTAPSGTFAYKLFAKACFDADIVPCSERTFMTELAKHALVRPREGKRMAYQNRSIVDYLDLKEAIHGVRPFQYVHIDHTELQIVLTVPGSTEKPERAWLSLAMDAESRAVVGFYLSFDSPGYKSCMMVIRDIVRRHGRMPDMLVLDNGKEFHSKAIQRLCALYGCSLRYRPAGRPGFGTVMERLFGTTQSQLINNLKGNTKALLHARMATKSILPYQFAETTLPALHGILDYYFETLYGMEPHPAHGDRPVEHLRDRMVQTGERRMRMVRFDELFLIESCPSPDDKDTRVVDHQRGVKINHFWYWNDALRNKRLDGATLPVRVDPWDVRHVYVLVDNDWVRCRSKLAWLVRNYTEVELRYAFQELAVRFSIKKKDLSPQRLSEWLRVLEAGRFDPRLAEGQSEVRLVYDALGMTNVPDPELDTFLQAGTDTPPVIEGTVLSTPKPARKFPKSRKREVGTTECPPDTGRTAPTIPIVPFQTPRANEHMTDRSFDDEYGLL